MFSLLFPRHIFWRQTIALVSGSTSRFWPSNALITAWRSGISTSLLFKIGIVQKGVSHHPHRSCPIYWNYSCDLFPEWQITQRHIFPHPRLLQRRADLYHESWYLLKQTHLISNNFLKKPFGQVVDTIFPMSLRKNIWKVIGQTILLSGMSSHCHLSCHNIHRNLLPWFYRRKMWKCGAFSFFRPPFHPPLFYYEDWHYHRTWQCCYK